MCQAMMENGVFDPALCPLLQDLDPEEIAERLASDEQIKACIRSIGVDAKAVTIVPGGRATGKRRAGKRESRCLV